jgi:hypothetical protein
MSDTETEATNDEDEQPPMEAARYPDGSILYPPHPVGPDGNEPVGTVDLSEYTATLITWTTSTATPPGVRQPNHIGIVEFEVSEASKDTSDSRTESGDDGEPVRAIGQLTTDDVEIGDELEPVYAAELREPGAGIREPESQSWDGYRFRPVE